MCGICGVVMTRDVEPGDVETVIAMRDDMAHRGPDDEGLLVSGRAVLGHRRLSIIDLAGGHQPMANRRETTWVTFNGEIYNFAAVRARLEAEGHTFLTKSDTEVILAAYDAYGDSFVDHLRGMFTMGLWDVERQELILVRDRLGIKPLYYTVHDGAFLFASEIKALLRWPGVPREVDPAALRDYLRYRYVPGPRTMFKGIWKLQPGHLLRVRRDGGVHIRRYWDLPLDAETEAPESAERRFRELLEECVDVHLVSDVPLGVFLSGGVDSTVVAGLMARTADAVRTFSVGYPDAPDSDETAYARLAAERFGTVHHELRLSSSGFWDFLPRMAWALDEPVADAASAPLYFLAKFARRSVTVVLSGEGADEMLAGYGIYRRMLWLERMRRLAPMPRLSPAFIGGKAARYLRWAAQPLAARYRGVSSVFGDRERDRVLAPAWRGRDDGDVGAEYFARTEGLHPLQRMLYFDVKVWLPDDLLVKADKMTMAASMELRVPFLDHVLMEWAWRLPPGLKLNGGTGKYLLRRAAADLLPPAIATRPKRGFAIPVQQWLREGLAVEARRLLVEEGEHRRFFDLTQVESLLAQHRRGGTDANEQLFALVMFALWHRTFIEARTVSAPPAAVDA